MAPTVAPRRDAVTNSAIPVWFTGRRLRHLRTRTEEPMGEPMNRRLVALTIATVAVLGLTACSGSSSSSEGSSEEAGNSAPAEDQNNEQSLAEACAQAGAQVEEATTGLTQLDVAAATADPQGTIAKYTDAAEAVGNIVDSISNSEVKAALNAFHEDFTSMGDVLSKVLIDKDPSAAAELGSLVSEIQESAGAVGELCAA